MLILNIEKYFYYLYYLNSGYKMNINYLFVAERIHNG